MRQLDGLRALAVIAVAWSHWRTHWFQTVVIPWGELGVETFFVISGFLITGILLDNRNEASKRLALKQFYIRRVLRIFPVFYATVFVALLWRADSFPESWPWHASYLSNVYFYLFGWHGNMGHFWSLAVEEQFYLCWPFLMVFLPDRFLLRGIIASILIAPVFETVMNFYVGHPSNVPTNVLMPCCMDSLGVGALFALAVRRDYRTRQLSLGLLFVGLIGYFLCSYSPVLDPFRRLAEAGVLGWLVFSTAEGFRGPVGYLLKSGPLTYLGKISYGLYLFHNFAAPLWQEIIRLLNSPYWLLKLFYNPVFRIFAFSSLTLALASYSWHRFEKPINRLKQKFPYPEEESTPVNLPQTGIPNPSP